MLDWLDLLVFSYFRQFFILAPEAHTVLRLSRDFFTGAKNRKRGMNLSNLRNLYIYIYIIEYSFYLIYKAPPMQNAGLSGFYLKK